MPRIIKRPMKAVHFEEHLLKFPVYASAKIDGLRCIHTPDTALSSTFKPIRNKHTRDLISAIPFAELDGELVSAGNESQFRVTMSELTRFDGFPQFIYYIFDYIQNESDLHTPFSKRYNNMCELIPILPHYVRVLPQRLLWNKDDLENYEESVMVMGAEGLVLRSPNSPYKFGRSTLREGYMLKVKRYIHSIAFITGIIEQAENQNDVEMDAFGLSKRSHVSANMEGKDTMGALIVQDYKTGAQFKIGSGLGWTIYFRKNMWDNFSDFIGRAITYKYFPIGCYTNPRHPIMTGFHN